MGELKRVGNCFTMGTTADYERRKAYHLSHLNPEKEYAVYDKIHCSLCRAVISVDLPEYNFYTKAKCGCVERRAIAEKVAEDKRQRLRRNREENSKIVPLDCLDASFVGMFQTDKVEEDYLEAVSRCENFCRRFEQVKESGRGIWLYGAGDSGKTYLAAAMLNMLQEYGAGCVFTTIERMFEELKESYRSGARQSELSIINKYAMADCLFIDGFNGIKAAKRGADSWALAKFDEIVKRRYEQHRPMVFTARQAIRDLYIGGLLSDETVGRLTAKQVQLKLTGNRRPAEQTIIEF